MATTVTTRGKQFLFNLNPLPPLVGIPNGASVKIRQRHGWYASVFVKVGDEITHNRVLPDGTLYPIARNVSVKEWSDSLRW